MYAVYLVWLQSSTRKLQWLEYLNSIFPEIPNLISWSVFQDQVAHIQTVSTRYPFTTKKANFRITYKTIQLKTLIVPFRFPLQLVGDNDPPDVPGHYLQCSHQPPARYTDRISKSAGQILLKREVM